MAANLTGSQLYTLLGNILGGQQIDTTLFYNLITTVQANIESSREWSVLKKRDTSKSITTSSTFQTSFALPSDFFFWQSEQPIVLTDPTNTANFIQYFKEIPMAKQFQYQFQTYRFATDLANSNIYIMGTVDRTYTIQMNYIYKPSDVTSTTSWVFPAQFHPLLAYGVAIIQKGGIDFDDQNRAMAEHNQKTYDMIYKAMVDWDDRLQVSALSGIDRGAVDERPWRSGAVDIFV